MRGGPLEDARVLRPLIEQLLAAAPDRPVARVAIAGDSTALTAAAHERWPHADVAAATVGDDPADVLLALPAVLLSHPLDALLVSTARCARLMVWDGGATHENALLRAWREVCGAPPPALVRQAGPVTTPAGWTSARVIDVARFDSIAQLCTALLDERGVAPPSAAHVTVVERIAHHLRACEAADGTLRIPVAATILERG